MYISHHGHMCMNDNTHIMYLYPLDKFSICYYYITKIIYVSSGHIMSQNRKSYYANQINIGLPRDDVRLARSTAVRYGHDEERQTNLLCLKLCFAFGGYNIFIR